ncbi:rhodanese-like domain-containing protein [sulfur-oxidizing endosymbiont of Gigantopelta aegis]|uniref:rhodanese-like domain-containing protein n=1 Tax=sulfur-oxidizing endosymbiont of Gigantopelta aegis TaxID=2794934 RepID=UPI0018DCF947|nr:rhodanese-like domain-containing protein [sulfur-oxidizing endosymbiont of Gigantopelta aegis]
MKSSNFLLLIVLLCLWFANSYASDESSQFPKRHFYPQLSYIDTNTFAAGVKDNNFAVIDVRDKTSFNALHVKGSTNIFVKSKDFEHQILQFIETHHKPIVAYCNGISCSKSYTASVKILQLFKANNIQQKILTYDSGINAIAYSYNDLVLKNGLEVSDRNPLISFKKIKKHTLEPEAFERFVMDNKTNDYAILDIREKSDRLAFKLFMFQKEKNITLSEREELIAYLNSIKTSKKTLLVYDTAGRQINGLYEMIKITGIKKWHYMQGGEYGYSQYARQSVGL